MMKFKVSMLLLIFAINAQAKINYAMGEWGSGGGNAVVCFAKVTEASGGISRVRDLAQEVRENGNIIPDNLIQYISSIELYDLYEAKKRRGLGTTKPKIIATKSNETVFDYVKRVASRFEKYVPYMQEIIQITRQVLPEGNFILEDSAVRYQNDLGSVVIPNDHCVISTIAAQVNYNQFYKVHIDGRLYNHPKHSKLSQAVLVLHETLYAYARAGGQTDSGTTRELVRYYITHGDDITEGNTAKALYYLDFGRANSEGWPSEYAKIYNESKIMNKIFSAFQDYVYGLGDVYNTINNSCPTCLDQYRKQISDAIDNNGNTGCNRVNYNDIDKIYASAACLKTQVGNKKDFEQMMKVIEQLYVELKKILIENADKKKIEISNMLKQKTNITLDDLSRFENNFDLFEYDSSWKIVGPGDFSSVYNEIAMDSNNLIMKVYDTQFGNACYATDIVVMPIPGDQTNVPRNEFSSNSSELKCVLPLKLDAIIPVK